MREQLAKDNIVWQLPMVSAENNNTGHIHGNAKPHAFVVKVDGTMEFSLCKRYGQHIKFFEEINIEGANPKHLCKKCLDLYKKIVY